MANDTTTQNDQAQAPTKESFGRTGTEYRNGKWVYEEQQWNPGMGKYETVTVDSQTGKKADFSTPKQDYYGSVTNAIGTSSANVPYSTPTSARTIGNLYGSSTPAMDDYQKRLKEQTQPVDEEKIRQEAINRVQSEIDAMNRFYAEKTQREQAAARVVGESRLGQNAAISARRGMIGSDFGAARTSTIEQANDEIQRNIAETNNARLIADRSAILGRASAAAEAEVARKQERLDAALQSALLLEKAQRERAEKAVDTRIAGLVAQGIEPSESDYDALAVQLGIDKETLKAKYAMSMPGGEKPIEVGGVLYQKQADGSYKALTPGKAEAGKGLLEVSPGASIYDPATGKLIATAPSQVAAPKYESAGGVIYRVNADGTLTAMTEKPSGLTDPQKVSTFNSIVNNYSKSPLVAARDRTPVLERSIKEVRSNPSDAALQMNLAYSYIQALDTYQSAVREGELKNLNSIDSKVGQLQNWVTQIGQGQTVRPEIAQQIANAADVIVDTIKSAADQKTRMYASQAQVAGVGPQWNEFILGAYGQAPTTAVPTAASPARVQDVENIAGMSLGQQQRQAVEEAIRDFPSATAEQIADVLGFKTVGGDTKPAVTTPSTTKTGMRTDRHNNPTAFTTDIARVAGLREGVDYVQGDPFSGGQFHTARLLGDPVATTIRVIDNIGFYTQGGKQRWVHTAMPKHEWDSLSYEQKKQVVKKMYGHEGGKELKNIFT